MDIYKEIESLENSGLPKTALLQSAEELFYEATNTAQKIAVLKYISTIPGKISLPVYLRLAETISLDELDSWCYLIRHGSDYTYRYLQLLVDAAEHSNVITAILIGGLKYNASHFIDEKIIQKVGMGKLTPRIHQLFDYCWRRKVEEERLAMPAGLTEEEVLDIYTIYERDEYLSLNLPAYDFSKLDSFLGPKLLLIVSTISRPLFAGTSQERLLTVYKHKELFADEEILSTQAAAVAGLISTDYQFETTEIWKRLNHYSGRLILDYLYENKQVAKGKYLLDNPLLARIHAFDCMLFAKIYVDNPVLLKEWDTSWKNKPATAYLFSYSEDYKNNGYLVVVLYNGAYLMKYCTSKSITWLLWLRDSEPTMEELKAGMTDKLKEGKF